MTYKNTCRLNEIAAPQSGMLLDERALASRWSISIRTLQNRRVSGRGIPFVKIGRSVRYRLADVVAVEISGLRFSTSEGSAND